MANTTIGIEGSAYRVKFLDSPEEKHLVQKDRTCSCGEKECVAIKSVEDYLRAGGSRAPDPMPPCPICGSKTYPDRDSKHRNPYTHEVPWLCETGGRSHYIQAKGQRIQENLARRPKLTLTTYEECQEASRRVFQETGYNPAM